MNVERRRQYWDDVSAKHSSWEEGGHVPVIYSRRIESYKTAGTV